MHQLFFSQSAVDTNKLLLLLLSYLVLTQFRQLEVGSYFIIVLIKKKMFINKSTYSQIVNCVILNEY